MNKTLPSQDIEFQPKTSEYSFSTQNPGGKLKKLLNTFFTLVVAIFSFLFLFLGLLAVLNYFNVISLLPYAPTITQNLPKKTDPVAVTLEILPNRFSDTETNVLINARQDNVTFVRLELKYDPKALKDVDIFAGDFLRNKDSKVVKNIDTKNGKVTLEISATKGFSKQGEGVLAILVFTPFDETVKNTTVSFLPQTEVRAKESTKSVLKSAVNGILSFQKQELTPIHIASESAQATEGGNLKLENGN